MSRIVVAIRVTQIETMEEWVARARRERDAGADMVEWRLDPVAEEPTIVDAAVHLVRESPLPSIVTIRDSREHGAYIGDDELRRRVLLAIATRAEPSYLDVELATIERDALLRAALRGMASSTRVILSVHDFAGRPVDLARRVQSAASEPCCSVIKVAWMARSVRDNLEAFELLAHRSKPMVALCMGPFGELSRGLAAKAGALWTYARPEDDEGTAPGQLTAAELREGWRLREQTSSTSLYGVIGWPVAHSRSPGLHREWFQAAAHDAVYARLPIPPEWEHFKATLATFVDDPLLGFRGASVTMPHKEHLIRLVSELGGEVDGSAREIGAANTLVRRRGGSWLATNTDAPAIAAISARLCGGSLQGKRVAVLGAGGVGRAAAWAVSRAGTEVLVWNRSRERAEQLVRELGGAEHGLAVAGTPAADSWGQLDLIIQATSVGMSGVGDDLCPDQDQLPEPLAGHWPGKAALMETVYEPQVTRALELASAAGVPTAGGLELLERQARLQSALWLDEA